MSANRFSFKAWHKLQKKWVHSLPCNLIGETILLGDWLDGVSIKDLNDIVVVQSTGLCDKNGKEMFEGDIVQSKGWDSLGSGLPNDTIEVDVISVIIWDLERGGWYSRDVVYTNDYLMLSDLAELEVIGNIYENKDLIPESK